MALRSGACRSLTCSESRQWMLRSAVSWMAASSVQLPLYQRRAFSRTLDGREASGRYAQAEKHALDDIDENVLADHKNKVLHATRRPKQSKEETMLEQEEAEDPERREDALSVLDAVPDDDPHTAQSRYATLETDSTNAETSQPPSDPNIPWYLQVQQPDLAPSETPLSARQRLPDLPRNPPPLLEPILTHVSTQLGMDDLSLLDLRGLDPPHPLGANLLMIVGTARSEKHLHVSADRLCRWLRSTQRLTPWPDGLMGRNELKLKKKRLRKRASLFSAAGAKATGELELDEGIRTGWICVNVGRVEGGELPEGEGERQTAEGVVGFGASKEGCSIVVQLFTEEKRGEVDLEKLWMGVLKRAKREAGIADEKNAVPDEAVEEKGEDRARAML